MRKKNSTEHVGPLVKVAVCSSIVLILATCTPDPAREQRQLALVVEKGANQVTFLDRKTQAILGSVVTGVAPHQIAVHEEAGLAVVSNYGSNESPGASLTVIDLHLMVPVRTISLGKFRRPHGIQFFSDGQRVLVVSEEGRAALVVDVREGTTLQMIPTGRVAARTVVLSPDEKIAYSIAAEDNELVVLDTVSSRLLEVVSLPMQVESLDISPDGDELWFVSRMQESILIVDTRSLETMTTLPCPGGPIHIRFLPKASPETADLLISLSHAAAVAFLDSSERSELARLPLGLSEEESQLLPAMELTPVPVELAVDRRNRMVYVSSSNTDLVTVIDPLNLSIVRRFVVADEPEGIAIVDLVVRQPGREPGDSGVE